MQQTNRQILAAELASVAHVWLLKTDTVTTPAQLADSAAILSPDETEICHRFRFEADRHLYLVSHAMLRQVLSAYTDIDPAAWRFSRNTHGRPEIASPVLALPLRFNLSHTRGLAACVVTRVVDCGVDVEEISMRRHAMGVAERMFASDEQQVLRTLDGQAFLERFFTYWTLREAYCKACGTGLANSGRHFWFEAGDEGNWQVRFSKGHVVTGCWRLEVQRLSDAHVVAVAVNMNNTTMLDIKFRDFSF
jgi:4'-phosphopantetheinyl transferase